MRYRYEQEGTEVEQRLPPPAPTIYTIELLNQQQINKTTTKACANANISQCDT